MAQGNVDIVALRKTIHGAFKEHGLTIKKDSTKFLCSQLREIEAEEWEPCLENIVCHLEDEDLQSSVVDLETVQTVVENMLRNAEEQEDIMDTEEGMRMDENGELAKKNVVNSSLRNFHVINAFDIPRFVYHSDRKIFLLAQGHAMLHAAPDVKSEVFIDRYQLLRQRVNRHEAFRPSVQGTERGTDYCRITPIDSLIALSEEASQEIFVFGLLCRMPDECYYVEDMTGNVKLQFNADTEFEGGLFTENSFVLVGGTYDDKILRVASIAMPPAEDRRESLNQFRSINFFGGDFKPQDYIRLRKVEEEDPDAMLVIISDVWLDKPEVMDKLRLLFEGYASVQPTAFVFFGNFLSNANGPSKYALFQESFNALCNMILEFPSLVQNSKFLFVPGPNDPGPGGVLPRPPIPSQLVERFQQKIKNSVFTSNPCRVRYCTQEIVLFREDIVNKIARNCIRRADVKTGEDVNKQLIKTLVDQSHLCPLPMGICPIYWAYDHCLRLYPLPDAVILADRFDGYSYAYENCQFINPGSFPNNEFSFQAYWTGSKECQESRV